MVLTVAPGGATYSLAYVTADDESMKVTGVYDFVSRELKVGEGHHRGEAAR